jgi:hypothetical protein
VDHTRTILQNAVSFGCWHPTYKGVFQYGTRKGWQAIALIMLLWLVLEKATKWGHACLIGSLDLFEALVALDGADC